MRASGGPCRAFDGPSEIIPDGVLRAFDVEASQIFDLI
jgi:hypothetical protein